MTPFFGYPGRGDAPGAASNDVEDSFRKVPATSGGNRLRKIREEHTARSVVDPSSVAWRHDFRRARPKQYDVPTQERLPRRFDADPLSSYGTATNRTLERAYRTELHAGRTLRDLSGPVSLSRAEWLEAVVEGYSSGKHADSIAAAWSRWGFAPSDLVAWRTAGVGNYKAFMTGRAGGTPELYRALLTHPAAESFAGRVVSEGLVRRVLRVTAAAGLDSPLDVLWALSGAKPSPRDLSLTDEEAVRVLRAGVTRVDFDRLESEGRRTSWSYLPSVDALVSLASGAPLEWVVRRDLGRP